MNLVIRIRLRRSDLQPGGSMDGKTWYVDSSDLRAQFFENSYRSVNRCVDRRRKMFVKELIRDSHSNPFDSARQSVCISRCVDVPAVWVARIVARECLHQYRRILHGARHWTGVVQRPRKRNDPAYAYTTVRWLQTDDAAQRSRNSDRTTCIRTHRPKTHAERYCACRSSARTA